MSKNNVLNVTWNRKKYVGTYETRNGTEQNQLGRMPVLIVLFLQFYMVIKQFNYSTISFIMSIIILYNCSQQSKLQSKIFC